MKAVRIHEFGDLNVLRWEEVAEPKPRAHQVVIKVESAGVNYADVMRRSGNYPGPALPNRVPRTGSGRRTRVIKAVRSIRRWTRSTRAT